MPSNNHFLYYIYIMRLCEYLPILMQRIYVERIMVHDHPSRRLHSIPLLTKADSQAPNQTHLAIQINHQTQVPSEGNDSVLPVPGQDPGVYFPGTIYLYPQTQTHLSYPETFAWAGCWGIGLIVLLFQVLHQTGFLL